LKYSIEITASAEAELNKLSPETHKRIISKALSLEENPRPPRISRSLEKPLHGYRLRVGQWRVLYTVDDKNRTVMIYAVRHRREAYRK
jgi:mRNA interferase RelE/StbE